MTKLYSAAADMPLRTALSFVPGGCALLTSPAAYRVARVADGDCVTPAGPVDLSAVYEARAFTEELELRWLDGRAVLLTENEDLLPGSFETIDPLPFVDVIETGYLVWGSATASAGPPAPGSTTLASRRVGTIDIPVTVPPEQSGVQLVAREYVAVEMRHGNAYVAEERLLCFKPYAPGENTR